MDGWIKLYRKIEESSFYMDSRSVHLWVHLLIKANKFSNKFLWNGEEITINPGQFITGRKKLSEQTGIEESKIQRVLKMFEKCHMIEQQMNSRNRLITILNWHLYQDSEQQMNSKRTADEQPMNTRKKERKKEGKKKDIILKPENVTEQTWNDFLTHRKNKKANVTQTVLNTFVSQSKKAGVTLEAALIETVSRGWTGFKAEWMKNSQKPVNNKNEKSLSEIAAEMNGNQSKPFDIELTDYQEVK